MAKNSIFIARFPYHKNENCTVTDWLVTTILAMRRDPRIGDIGRTTIDDTPITMTRNQAVLRAQQNKADYLLMIDSDMAPDAYAGSDPKARPFWECAFDFALEHQGPCVIGAPYCGPPPHENIYVFQWASRQTDAPEVDFSLDQYTREEASKQRGITKVAALPTGLTLFDMRAFDYLPEDKPYFDYEWTDGRMVQKASTEDVVLTRNLSLAGVPQYCTWDSWAGHWKLKCVGRPKLITENDVAEELREAILRSRRPEEALDAA